MSSNKEKEVSSINIQFDSLCNRFQVWLSYTDGTYSDGRLLTVYDEDSAYYFHKELRDLQDYLGCYTVYFY